ncbi:hypothetical protein HDU93_009839 [Gonapodya sp. JEL0774]|nr:hypothetical protein HDU93_009839 [Gonapodya sp. JEL0774]
MTLLPRTTHNATDTLPTEILQRIIRFLPPRTVYGVISRTSRRFRDAYLDPIPGCPSGTVWITCHVWAQDRDSQHIARRSYHNPNGFECVEYGGNFVWTALTTAVTVTHSRAAENRLEQIDTLLGDQIRIASLKSGAKLPWQARLKVLVKEIWFYLETDVDSFDLKGADKMRTEGQVALETFIRFARKMRVGTFALHGAALNAVSKLAPDVIAHLVERLMADNAMDATWHCNLPFLLRVFPHASALGGSAFYPKKTDTFMSWCDIESPTFAARRASITSLDVASSHDLDLLEFPISDNGHELRESESSTRFFDTIMLEEAADSGRELDIASEYASVIHHLFPNLLDLHIEHSLDSETAIATLGAFLGEIFHATPSRCKVRVEIPHLRRKYLVWELPRVLQS